MFLFTSTTARRLPLSGTFSTQKKPGTFLYSLTCEKLNSLSVVFGRIAISKFGGKTVSISSKNLSTFAHDLEYLGIQIPRILLPIEGSDLSKWSVVACDQYTSDRAYWDRVESQVGDAPSTLRITLPEIFLEAPDVESRIQKIQDTMKSYIEKGVLKDIGETIIYIERRTASSGLRQGLLFAMDLEKYDYSRDSKTLIRATEGTIVERIPPRLRVRKEASIEIPHIMILIDDPQRQLIETIAANMLNKRKLYDINLMEHGGNLAGWAIEDSSSISELVSILKYLFKTAEQSQGTKAPLFFAMGDGNHSLATAKAHWEALKTDLRASGLSEEQLMNHPSRYALAEIVNIHSPGLRFEPIHRAFFCSDTESMSSFIQNHPFIKKAVSISEADLKILLESPDGQNRAGIFDGKNFFALEFVDPYSKLPPAFIDEIYANWNSSHSPKAKIDFIHGWNDTKKLTRDGAIACFVPVIARERLFRWVAERGPLPRKAFSMGDAEEKKYYMESRCIR